MNSAMYTILTTLMITVVTHVAISLPAKVFAGSHALEISLQNCEYAKQVAATIMKKKELLKTFKLLSGIRFQQSSNNGDRVGCLWY